MLPATLVSPSDIKPVLGVFKSILGICTAEQAGQHTGQQPAATTGHQQATACQHWAELGRSADQAKNPAKAGQNQGRSKGKNTLHMTLCTFSEKSIITLFRYCMYTALYEKPVQNDKNGYFLACIEKSPPRPIFLDPFFSRSHLGFFPCK